MPDLQTAFNSNGGTLTLRELFDGMDLVHGGVAFELEPGTAVLPGSKTNNQLGGYAGHGKGLFMTWQYEPTAGSNYNDAWVDIDLVFTGTQASN